MDNSKPVAALIDAIRRLPADGVKEQWLDWLADYHTPGYYGRQVDPSRDAKYAYNHINNPDMLVWLIEAAGVESELVHRAKRAADGNESMPTRSAAVRKCVPWPVVAEVLWHDGRATQEHVGRPPCAG